MAETVKLTLVSLDEAAELPELRTKIREQWEDADTKLRDVFNKAGIEWEIKYRVNGFAELHLGRYQRISHKGRATRSILFMVNRPSLGGRPESTIIYHTSTELLCEATPLLIKGIEEALKRIKTEREQLRVAIPTLTECLKALPEKPETEEGAEGKEEVTQ